MVFSHFIFSKTTEKRRNEKKIPILESTIKSKEEEITKLYTIIEEKDKQLKDKQMKMSER